MIKISSNTLKSKISALLEKAKFANMFYKWLKYEPYDLYLGEGFGLGFDDLFLANGSEKTVYLADATIVTRSLFDADKFLTRFDGAEIVNVQQYAFRGCTALNYVKLGTLTTLSSNAFYQCASIEDFIIGKDTNTSLNISYSTLYSQEVLHNIIDNLVDLTGQTAKKLTIGTENIEKISAEYIHKLEAKNWTYI